MTEKKKVGRPTIYNNELARLICERIATHEMGLQRLCNKYDDMPDKTTINEWRYKYPEFSHQYAQAKMMQAELFADEIIDIADDGSNDWMESYDLENGCEGWRANGEHIQRSRLRIDSRKWIASKLAPKIYGEKVQTETTVKISHEQSLKELE